MRRTSHLSETGLPQRFCRRPVVCPQCGGRRGSAGRARTAGIGTSLAGLLLVLPFLFTAGAQAQVVDGSGRAAVAPVANPSASDTLTSLTRVLEAKTLVPERVPVIRQLGLLPNGAGKDALRSHFGKLRRGSPSSESRQTEKEATLKALVPVLSEKERPEFLMEVVREEVAGMREAQSDNTGLYYPHLLLANALDDLTSCGMTRATRDELAAFADDKDIFSADRERLLSHVLRYDMAQEGATTPATQSRIILERILVRPRGTPIPWDVYRAGPDARAAYYKGHSEMTKRDKEIGAWYRSMDGIRNAAQELVLQALGLPAAAEIVAALGDPGVAKDRKDYFAELGARILGRGALVLDPDKNAAAALAIKLADYVETMPDLGFGDHRSSATMDLNAFFIKTGNPRRFPNPAISVPKTP